MLQKVHMFKACDITPVSGRLYAYHAGLAPASHQFGASLTSVRRQTGVFNGVKPAHDRCQTSVAMHSIARFKI